MSQKILISILGALILVVISAGVLSALPQDTTPAATTGSTTGNIAGNSGNGSAVAPASNPEPQINAQDTVGDVWEAQGTIASLDDNGFTLSLNDTQSVYVELGPTEFWQSQPVSLNAGDNVIVYGWNNGEQIHARLVEVNGAQMELRSEDSRPLWSGGASNGQNGTHESGTGQLTFQVAPEDWLTISGTLTSVANGSIVMEAVDGMVYTLQMGQPNFWKSQGVALNVGDAVEVLGFWMNEQFTVGDITTQVTGEHIILRDPNGRQLWGGPGRNGNSGQQSTAVTTPDGQ